MGGSSVNCKLYSKTEYPTRNLVLYHLSYGMKGHLPIITSKCGGALQKVLAPLPKKTKLGERTMDCIFIGYVLNSSAYRFLVHKSEKSDIRVNIIIKFRDAVFFENIFLYKGKTDKTSEKRTHEMAFREESPKEPIVNAEIESRRNQRSRISKSFGSDFIAYAIESHLSNI